MIKMEYIQQLKEFLVGNESSWVTKNALGDAMVLSKIIGKDGVTRVFAGSVRSFEQKFSSELIFYFFKEEKAVVYHRNCAYWDMALALGINPEERLPSRNEVPLEVLGYKCFEFGDVCNQVEKAYMDETRKRLFAKYPNFDALPTEIQDKALKKRGIPRQGYTSGDKSMVLRGMSPFLKVYVPFQNDKHDLVWTFVTKGKMAAVEILMDNTSKDEQKDLLVSAGVLFKIQEGMKLAEESLTEAERQRKEWVSGIEKVNGKTVSVIYDSKKILSALTEYREMAQKDDVWQKVFNYLDTHDQLVFKAEVASGFDVTSDRFICPYHTDMSTKKVFGLGSYTSTPLEFDQSLGNMDALVDIQFRGKSVKAI